MTYLSVILVIILSRNLVISEQLTEVCKTNQIILLLHAFRLQKVVVIFVNMDGETKVIQIKLNDKIFDETYTNLNVDDVWPKPNSGDIKLWPNWNQHLNGTIINEINDFVSVYSIKQNLMGNDINDNSLIFTTLDRDNLETKFMFGYHVKYDTNLTRIVSVNKFQINPYKPNLMNDPFNLGSLYSNFPEDFKEKATPIVIYNVPQSPQRAIVYYIEVNPKIPSESNYKIHFLIQNESSTTNTNEKPWVYDTESSECIRKTNETHVVSAAFALTDVKSRTMSSFDYMLNVIEFYHNGDYTILDILVKRSGAVNPESFNNINRYYKLTNIICLPNTETSPIEQSTSTTKPTKSSTWWIWVVVILAILIGAAVIGLYYYFYMYRRPTPEAENIEMRERAAQKGVADETEGTEAEGSVKSADSSDTSQGYLESEASVEPKESLRTANSGTLSEESKNSSKKREDSGSETSSSYEDVSQVVKTDVNKKASLVEPEDSGSETSSSFESVSHVVKTDVNKKAPIAEPEDSNV